MNRQPPQSRSRMVASRRERRDRNRKKADFAGAFRVLLSIALVAECLRVAFCSPRLKLAQVEVGGTQRYSAQDVQREAGVELGQNIFRVNLVKVGEQLRRDPVIRDAVVTRELPRTVRVDITERVPAIQVVSPGGAYHADREGVVFEKAATLNRKLPLLTLPAHEVPSLGGSLKPERVRAFWECDRLARKEHLKLLNVSVDDAGELWLNTGTSPSGQAVSQGLAVRIGQGTELPEKFRTIRQTLHSRPDLTTKASFLNVMCAARPAFTPSEAAAQP